MLKNVDAASSYLDKLASILRFMLYESKAEKIALSKELEYIQMYIDLQKIRTTNNDYVNYTVTETEFKHQIPPMLFIPFIENSFKHVSSKKIFHAIDINILIEKDKIVFYCKNAFKQSHQTPSKDGGIGDELIKKRLQILYPNRHHIKRTITDNYYTIQLTILTHEN